MYGLELRHEKYFMAPIVCSPASGDFLGNAEDGLDVIGLFAESGYSSSGGTQEWLAHTNADNRIAHMPQSPSTALDSVALREPNDYVDCSVRNGKARFSNVWGASSAM
jgi:hypothetical protein